MVLLTIKIGSDFIYWVASAVIAILLYFLQRRIKYPGQLRFVVIETWKVMSSSPKAYKDLSLKFNDCEIKEDLEYVKFMMYNVRSYDYSSGDEGAPVRLTLPDDYKWIDAKIVNRSEEVQAEIVDITSKELSVRFKLLRKNEFIELEGLLERKAKTTLREIADVIKVHHRIPNVASVKNVALVDSNEYQKAKSYLRTFGVVLFLFLSILLYSLVIKPASPIKFKNVNTGEKQVLLVDKDGKIVYHKGLFIWNGYSDPITPEEFLKQYEPCFESSKFEKTDFIYLGLFSVITVVLLMCIITYASSVIKYNEIKRLLLKR